MTSTSHGFKFKCKRLPNKHDQINNELDILDMRQEAAVFAHSKFNRMAATLQGVVRHIPPACDVGCADVFDEL